MAVVAPVDVINTGSGEIIQKTWTLANGDTGVPIAVPNNYDSTIHIYGTFGTGGSGTMFGSNNFADFNANAAGSGTWVALTDPQGNAITKTSRAIESVLEQALYMAPGVTAGDGTTSIVFNLIMRRKGLS